MRRRDFLWRCGSMAVWSGGNRLAEASRFPFPEAASAPSGESLVGKPANLARFGELKSWLNPEATLMLPREIVLDQSSDRILRLGDLAWKNSEIDVGIEWAEFRTVCKVVIRFSAESRAPAVGRQYLECWDGSTALQGQWREIEDTIMWGLPRQGVFPQIDGATWTYEFSPRKTCKLRLRFANPKQVDVAGIEVYGLSRWKSGEVSIEWGLLDREECYDGRLEIYNGELMDVREVGTTRLDGPFSWAAMAGNGKLGGVVAKLLYTWGDDTDRTVLTVRTKFGSFSFLPGETIEHRPIDAPDFGVFIRNSATSLDRAEFRRQHAGGSRLMDAVTKRPEQTLANAYESIHAARVSLCFVGVDSNNQKFGIAPDGHWVVGNSDSAFGKPIIPTFAVYFDSAETSTSLEHPAFDCGALFKQVEEKRQELEEGWLPIVTTVWSRNEVRFERTDFAALPGATEPVDQLKLLGDELAVLVSRLRIRNTSPDSKTAGYFLKPHKSRAGRVGFGALPPDAENAWVVSLDEGFVKVLEGDKQCLLLYIDTRGSGQLAADPQAGAIRYSVRLDPGQEQTIFVVLAGQCLSAGERGKLQDLPYERLWEATAKYWKGRLAEGMQVQVPDVHLQNIYNATLHHFYLAMTRDGKRGEYYPNTSTFDYGSIGSESSPIIQALDMRGLHERSAACLQAWLSTQGDTMPDGDYASKEGGFYHYWAIYSISQGGVLRALAEHYLYTRDSSWLRKVAPQIVAGCDFIIRERKRIMKELPSGSRPVGYGLAPAGTVADMRDWSASFFLNGWFYLGLKKSAQVLRDVDPENAERIATEAADYRQAIRAALKESIALSPLTRLRDDSSVPSVPWAPGVRGFRFEVKDIPDVSYGGGYVYDVECGPFQLLKSEVLDPGEPEVTWMLNYLEDLFFMRSPGPSMVQLDRLAEDWFDLGGFAKLQPYYLHYQDAYLQRDQIKNFLRGFFNTLAAASDPQTLTFRESLPPEGGQPNKTHEVGWFFHQLRFMLLMEMGEDLHLARGVPREWLENGKQVAVRKAPSYFGEVSYTIQSFSAAGRIEAVVNPPRRSPPARLYLRLRHPNQKPVSRVTVNGRAWTRFETDKEWINLPTDAGELRIVAYY